MGDLEELFYKHGVNVVLAGHVAALERINTIREHLVRFQKSWCNCWP